MEMKPTLQICIGNWTQNDAQVELIMMKMKRTSAIFFLIPFSYPKKVSPKSSHIKTFKIFFLLTFKTNASLAKFLRIKILIIIGNNYTALSLFNQL